MTELETLIREYARDLRRNSSGGDDYPWEYARGTADYLEVLIGRAAATPAVIDRKMIETVIGEFAIDNRELSYLEMEPEEFSRRLMEKIKAKPSATPAVGGDVREALKACDEYLSKRTSIKWSDPLRAQVRDALAAQPASPLRGRELLAVGTRVRQSKVYAGTRDGTVKWSDDKEFTVVWDGVTVACTYDAAYLSKDALVECSIAVIAVPPEQPAARGHTQRPASAGADGPFTFLPCPFCGSDPKRAMGDRAVIYCASDDCFGPRTTADYLIDAIEQWNRRAAASPEQPAADPVEQPAFDYFECKECGFSSVQLAGFKGSDECPLCAGDSGHSNIMSRRIARETDKPEGVDARKQPLDGETGV